MHPQGRRTPRISAIRSRVADPLLERGLAAEGAVEAEVTGRVSTRWERHAPRVSSASALIMIGMLSDLFTGALGARTTLTVAR